jgi:site-specific DNA-methyltransferase (adenine-specific)
VGGFDTEGEKSGGYDVKLQRRNDWGTPGWLFRQFDDEFGFTVDAAANESNHKLERYWGLEDDGLAQSWADECVWCNPPYGGAAIPAWVEKAIAEDALAVLLLPVRTEMAWWSRVIECASEIRFVQGRVHFELPGFCDRKGSRPVFASVVVIFRPGPKLAPPLVTSFQTPRIRDRLRQMDLFKKTLVQTGHEKPRRSS